jgi:glycosyltransferase involved in cell wall biosynthesis
MPALKIAWISDFPIEWLDDVPKEIAMLSRGHPSTWQRVLLNGLKEHPDLELHVLVLRKQVQKSCSFEWHGVKFHIIKVPGGIRAPTFFWVDTLVLRPVLKRIQPHLVHAWGSERGAALVAGRLGYPYLVTIQGLLSWYREQVPLNRHERFSAWLETRSLPKAPLVTTESRFAVSFLNSRFPRLQIRQAEHAPAEIFHQVNRKPQIKPLRILFVGALDYRKGGDVLLHSLDQLKEKLPFELRILGGVNARLLADLKTTTSARLWDSVEIKSNLLPNQIAEELAEGTMMVFPTRADTSPNAVKEAVVAGVPVVASKVGGIPDYVFAGQNGVLFEPDSVSACVNAVTAACSHPLFSQGRVDPLTLKSTRDYLSPNIMRDRFVEIYHEAAALK